MSERVEAEEGRQAIPIASLTREGQVDVAKGEGGRGSPPGLEGLCRETNRAGLISSIYTEKAEWTPVRIEDVVISSSS